MPPVRSVRALLDTWKRYPFIGLLAALSVLLLPAMSVWLTARVYVPVLAGVRPSVADFSYYYEAAGRFLQDALALYPDAYGFMYPPPSVLLFLPFRALPMPPAFMLAVVGIAVMAAVCVGLTLWLYEAWRGERLSTPMRVSLLLIGMATAPVFQNMKYAQANVAVLLTGLLFLVLLRKDRPFAAALVLSLGFWLKLYPLALGLLGLRRKWIAPGSAGLLVGLVGVPLVLLPFVPAELYRQYFFDLVPFWSEITNMDALNQSITGVLEHLRQPVSDYLRSHDTPLHPLTKAVNVAATLGLLGGLYAAYFLGRLQREVVGVAVLAVLPLVSGLGWEHTYVLALPLYLFVLLEARHRGTWARALAAASVLVFMIPKLPQPQMEWTFAHWPRPVVDVFYARFLLVTLVLLGVAAVWMWERRRVPSPLETTRTPVA